MSRLIVVFKGAAAVPRDRLHLRVRLKVTELCLLHKYPDILVYINPKNLTHTYKTRNQSYVLLFSIVETIRLNFKYQLINIWNEVPENIRELESYNMFKGELCNKSLFITMTL